MPRLPKRTAWLILVLALILSACIPHNDPDFVLAIAPGAIELTSGNDGEAGVTVTITPMAGFTGTVALGLADLPQGITGTFDTNPVTSSTLLTVTTSGQAPVGRHELEVVATAAETGLRKTATLVVNITQREEEEVDVIIPDTTVVLDETVQANLLGAAPDGSLQYAEGSPALADVEVGDVLVGAPTPLTPYGFLRRVTAVERQAGRLVFHTEPADLLDAIHKGSLDVRVELTAEDLTDASAAALGLDPQKRVELPFSRSFDDEVIYDRDGNHDTRGDQVRASGSIELSPYLEIKIDIDQCYVIAYPCVDTFKFLVGAEQHADLQIDAELTVPIDEEIELFPTIRFTSFKFWIGWVPVWITPRLTITAGIDGQVEARATFTAAEDATVVAGVSYDRDDGWDIISHRGFRFSEVDADFSGQARIRGYLGAQFDLMAYDLIGPYAELVASLELEGRFPTWKLDGCLRGYAGINTLKDIPVAGRLLKKLEHHAEVFVRCDKLAGNASPTVRIVTPDDGSELHLGQQLHFSAIGSDPDGGGLSCCSYTWRSDKDGRLGTGSGIDVTFTTPGRHVITVTATDPEGATARARVSIEVVNTAPTVTITRPTADQELHAQETVRLRGTSFDPNEPNARLACDRLEWRSSRARDPFPVRGCNVEVVFPTAGSRTLTLIGTDPQGARSRARVTITVLEERENPPPIVEILRPSPKELGESVNPDERITLRGRATDPDGEGLGRFRWTFTLNGETFVIGTGRELEWAPSDSTSFPWCSVHAYGTLRLRVKDASGNAGFDEVTLWISRMC